jgi:hypothetical protein
MWHHLLRDSELVQRDEDYDSRDHFGSEGFGLYHWRLLRDGWVYHGKEVTGEYNNSIELYEKQLANGWILRRLAHTDYSDPPVGRGRDWDEHALYFPATGKEVLCPSWEWADLANGRLMWSSRGMLCTGVLDDDGIAAQHTLYDFNEMTFERIVAPY